MAQRFDSYHKWLGIPREDQPPHHYRLLGINEFESDVDVIDGAADRIMSYLQQLSTGEHTEQAQDLLNQISAARLTLLSRERKHEYDQELRSRLYPAQPDAQPAPARPTGTANQPERHESPRSRRNPLLIGGLVCACVLIVVIVQVWPKATHDSETSETVGDARNAKTSTASDAKSDLANTTVAKSAEQPLVPRVDQPGHGNSRTATKTQDSTFVKPLGPVSLKPPSTSLLTKLPKSDPKTKVEPTKVEPTEAVKEPEARPEPVVVPDARELEVARKLVQDVYRNQYAQQLTHAARVEFVIKLIDTGKKTNDDAASRFVLFEVAEEIAAELGDIQLCMTAIDVMAEHFHVAPVARKVDRLAGLSKSARTVSQNFDLADFGFRLMWDAVAADEFVQARQLEKLASSAARKTKHGDLVKFASVQSKLFLIINRTRTRVTRALVVLQEKPDDQAANLTVGKFRCLVQGLWDDGLPLLAKGSDLELGDLAKSELSLDGTDVASEVEVADRWWQLAEATENVIEKNRLLQHSSEIYSRTLSNLDGLTIAKVENRITFARKAIADSQFKLKHPLLGYQLKRHPYQAVPYKGHWYVWFPEKVASWNAARQRCEELGGYLACVESPEENLFLGGLTQGQSSWLGGASNAAGQWYWLTGAQLGAAPWGNGQPDNGAGAFLQMMADKTWGDIDPPNEVEYAAGFVCEWEY